MRRLSVLSIVLAALLIAVVVVSAWALTWADKDPGPGMGSRPGSIDAPKYDSCEEGREAITATAEAKVLAGDLPSGLIPTPYPCPEDD